MARPRGGRSASRRNTPISPPKRPTMPADIPQRSTRSQNRDQRNGGVENAGGVGVDDRERTNRGPRPQEGKRLDTVTEVGETVLGELQQEDNYGQDDEDASSQSVVSTAQDGIISHYQALVSELDRDLIVDSLPAVLTSAEGLLRFFDVAGIDQLRELQAELVQPGSKASKRLSNLADTFEMAKRNFGDSPEIELEIILPFIAGLTRPEPLEQGIWRPDVVLYLANLARYVLALLTMNRNGEERGQLLESFHNAFPTSFTRDRTSESTVFMALELRTQRLLNLLIEEQDFASSAAEDSIKEVFLTPEGDLRGLDPADDQTPIPPGLATLFSQRMALLNSFLSDKSDGVTDIDELTSEFPYEVFLAQILDWAKILAEDHRGALKRQGGILVVQEAIRSLQDGKQKKAWRPSRVTQNQDQQGSGGGSGTSVGRPVVARREQPAKDANPTKTRGAARRDPRKSGDLEDANATAFKKRRSLLEARKAQAMTGDSVARMDSSTDVIETTFQAVGDDEEPARSSPWIRADKMPSRSQQGEELQENFERQAAVANKENLNTISRKPRFADRQPGAERVNFDGQENHVNLVVRKRNAGKRKVRDEDDEDDDFEEDDRETNSGLRREIPKALGQKSPPKRPRLEDQADLGNPDWDDTDDETTAAGNHRLQKNIATAERTRVLSERNQRAPRSTSVAQPVRRTPLREGNSHRISSSAPIRYESEVAIGTQAASINKLARENTRKIMRPKTQVRSAWTYEETGRLVDLIQEYGVSWVALKMKDDSHPEGPLLSDRDQVSLKDKARNLKMDFLRAKRQLPENFDRIALGNRLISKLEAQGIRVNERDDDYDDD